MLSLPAAFVLLAVAWAILGLSCRHIRLISFASNLHIDSGGITIFTRSLLPTHEHGRPIDLLVFSSIFPFSVLQFFCRGLVSLVYSQVCLVVVIFLCNCVVCIVSGIVSLAYFSLWH